MLTMPSNEVEIFINGKWTSMMITDGSFEEIVEETNHINSKYWKIESGTLARYKGKEFKLN